MKTTTTKYGVICGVDGKELQKEQAFQKGEAAQEEANTVQVIEDDWRDRALAHRVLDRQWHGETHFEVSTGEWKSYIHHSWRHALMTPKRVRALDLDEGTQWTGRRRTLVRAFKQ